MANVLVVYAHPNYNLSRMNKALINEINGINHVVISNLYKKYPDGKIDVVEEQRLILASDLIILQFPYYWFNTTPLIKAWLDEVFLEGFAYGVEGNKLVGKKLMCCITIGSSKERYLHHYIRFDNSKDHAIKGLGFTLPDLLKPFEGTAKYCGMVYKKPFVVPNYNVDNDTLGINDKNLQHYTRAYKNLLIDYINNGDNALENSYPSVD